MCSDCARVGQRLTLPSVGALVNVLPALRFILSATDMALLQLLVSVCLTPTHPLLPLLTVPTVPTSTDISVASAEQSLCMPGPLSLTPQVSPTAFLLPAAMYQSPQAATYRRQRLASTIQYAVAVCTAAQVKFEGFGGSGCDYSY